jgi:hypothetical protein
VRRPSQQSISLDPRGNSESILLTSFVVLEWILGVGDNVIRMMPLKLNSKHQKPVLRNRVWMASSYSNRTPERGNTTSHSNRLFGCRKSGFTGMWNHRNCLPFLDSNCLARWRHVSHLGYHRLHSVRHHTGPGPSYRRKAQGHADCRVTSVYHYILPFACR